MSLISVNITNDNKEITTYFLQKIIVYNKDMKIDPMDQGGIPEGSIVELSWSLKSEDAKTIPAHQGPDLVDLLTKADNRIYTIID